MPLVAIDQVSIRSDRRPLNAQKVAELMESIKANGLLNPITLDQHLTLVAGLHRLTACRLLGLDQIECNIVTYEDRDQARLAEIDENLIRNELEALDRSELWLERDQLLARLGLRAKPGDNQYTLATGTEATGGEMISPAKTTLELAQEIGYTERMFQLGKQIAKDIVPDVKAQIRGTPIAKSPSALLQVARAGSQERKRAEQAEKAVLEANQTEEAKTQAEIAAEARAKQKELQLLAFQSVQAEREGRQTRSRKTKDAPQKLASANQAVEVGDEWLLQRHLVYCGDTADRHFINLVPTDAALAIALPCSSWQHDYLVDKAHVVAVLCPEGCIHGFCTQHQMPFQFEWVLGGLYVSICSRHPLSKPNKPSGIEGIEAVVSYLVSLYTKPNNFVIAPFLGYGEVLITCERMGRICFGGDPNPKLATQAIDRWQKWTGRQAEQFDTEAL